MPTKRTRAALWTVALAAVLGATLVLTGPAAGAPTAPGSTGGTPVADEEANVTVVDTDEGVDAFVRSVDADRLPAELPDRLVPAETYGVGIVGTGDVVLSVSGPNDTDIYALNDSGGVTRVDGNDTDRIRLRPDTVGVVVAVEGFDFTGNGAPSADVDDDGLHEDVTGEGDLTTADVVSLFRNLESAGERPDLYDYTGDGEVTTADVVALFERLSS